jgi:hypothetical protein
MVAAGNGDFAMLRADLAAKGIQGSAEFLALAEQSWTKVKAERDAIEAKDKQSILDAVGGEKNWNAIREWGAKNAEPTERTQIAAALNAGGFVARATARLLAESFAKASGTTIEPANVARSDAAGGSRGSSGGPLNGTQYISALAELKSRVGATNLDGNPEYLALVQRRRAYKG